MSLRNRTVVVPPAAVETVPTDKNCAVTVPLDTVILCAVSVPVASTIKLPSPAVNAPVDVMRFAVIEPFSSTTKALFAAVSVPVDVIEEAVTEPVALIVEAVIEPALSTLKTLPAIAKVEAVIE